MLKSVQRKVYAAVVWVVLVIIAALIASSPLVARLNRVWSPNCEPEFLVSNRCQDAPIIAQQRRGIPSV